MSAPDYAQTSQKVLASPGVSTDEPSTSYWINSGLSKLILHILPRRSITPDGVGDYATRLADEIYAKSGISSFFLQGSPFDLAPPRTDCWENFQVLRRSPSALRDMLKKLVDRHDPVAIFVHVSIYGYEKRGVPFWLSGGVARWKRSRTKLPPLLMIFHELWAADDRDPLRSSFWLRPAQKRIVCQLFGLADVAITTTEFYRRRLLSACQNSKGKPLLTQNVFSNVGEPLQVPAVERRPQRLVTFSGPGLARLANEQEAGLREVFRLTNVDEIIDVGERKEAPPRSILGVPVVVKGSLQSKEVSAALIDCKFGLLPYGNRFVLGKSGVLAAYAAHGVVPIAIDVSHEDSDGLIAGEHYMVASSPAKRKADLESLQQRLLGWYEGHTLSYQAKSIVSIVQSLVGDFS